MPSNVYKCMYNTLTLIYNGNHSFDRFLTVLDYSGVCIFGIMSPPSYLYPFLDKQGCFWSSSRSHNQRFIY